MAVTLNLKPEIETGLLAQARAAGLPLEEFLAQHLEVLAEASDVVSTFNTSDFRRYAEIQALDPRML
jgi:hypothetical protein